MADEYKIVRSPILEDQELPEIHYHNDVDQPAIALGDLPAGTDHSTLSNVTIDQHHARDHATRHLSGGGDALTLTATEVPTSAWAADIIPSLDSAYDLGSTTIAFRTIYVDTIKSITGNPLALTPIAGQSLTVNLATTGDFIVNTDDLVVDTSAGYVGIGTASPAQLLSIGANVHLFSVTAGGEVVINETGADINFRVESDDATDLINLDAGADTGAGAIGFFSVTPQIQQATIADADGSLADITTKFNTLLADLEGYGLLKSV